MTKVDLFLKLDKGPKPTSAILAFRWQHVKNMIHIYMYINITVIYIYTHIHKHNKTYHKTYAAPDDPKHSGLFCLFGSFLFFYCQKWNSKNGTRLVLFLSVIPQCNFLWILIKCLRNTRDMAFGPLEHSRCFCLTLKRYHSFWVTTIICFA